MAPYRAVVERDAVEVEGSGTPTASPRAAPASRTSWLAGITLEHVVLVSIVAIAAAATAGPISGNTMLVHLRTGTEMVRSWSIPRRDPYSFTAASHPWVVQSWLVEASYGLLRRVGGMRAVLYEQVVLSGSVGLVLAALGRTRTMVGTASIGALGLMVAVPELTPRPQLVALVCFGITCLVIDRRHPAWWLLPVGWIWVSSHGSYVYGPFLALLALLGALLDGRARRDLPIRYVVAALGGAAIGGLNPLGPRLLLFPLTATLDRGEVFRSILEWGPPDFRDASGMVVLIGLLGSIGLLIGLRPERSWSRLLPALVFVGLGLYAVRNLPFAALAIAPALRQAWVERAAALRPIPGPGSTGAAGGGTGDRRIAVIAMAVVLTAVVGMLARVAVVPPLSFHDYPVDAMSWMQAHGMVGGRRIAAQDVVGCYRVFRDGAEQPVFIDDRYDMYPVAVSLDSLDLLRTTKDPQVILDRYRVDVVLWQVHQPLSAWLSVSRGWRLVHHDDHGPGWVVYERVQTVAP